MLKWLRNGLLGLAVFVVAALVLTAVLRWFAVSDEARADVALLSAPAPEPQGRSGFAALALVNHEVPPEQREAAMAEDVARFRAFQRANREARLAMARQAPHAAADTALSYEILGDGGYPPRERLDLGPDSAACTMLAKDCLAKVQADADATRALLAQAGVRVAQVEEALAADHLATPYPTDYAAPLPPLQMLRLPLTAAALDAVEGRPAEGMARACAVLSQARRHGATSAELIGKMVMVALADGAMGLLVDIRRASPDGALPPSCAEALRPVQASDYLVCEAIRSEFRLVSQVGHELDDGLAQGWDPRDMFLRQTAFDGDTLDAWIAPRHADLCRDGYREQVLAGVVPDTRVEPLTMANPTCWGAVVSCLVAGIASPDLGQYQRRLLDGAAKLRLRQAALAVLEGQLPRDAAAAAAASPGYVVRSHEDGTRLSIELREPTVQEAREFSIAL